MKLLFTLLLLPFTALASIMEIEIHGKLSEETGTFFDLHEPTLFVFRLQFDTEAVDWDTDPHVGEYFSLLPTSLDFGDWHFETVGTRVTVLSDAAGLNRGFRIWSDEPFTQNGYGVAEYGMYAEFLTFGLGIVPDDSLASVQPYDISDERSGERFYLINEAYPSGPGASRLLSDSMAGIDSLTIREVPDRSSMAFVLLGMAVIGYAYRR